MRLSAAQKRHLVELYGDGSKPLYWHVTPGSPEYRTARVLERHGLIEREGYSMYAAYSLTQSGMATAVALRLHEMVMLND